MLWARRHRNFWKTRVQNKKGTSFLLFIWFKIKELLFSWVSIGFELGFFPIDQFFWLFKINKEINNLFSVYLYFSLFIWFWIGIYRCSALNISALLLARFLFFGSLDVLLKVPLVFSGEFGKNREALRRQFGSRGETVTKGLAETLSKWKDYTRNGRRRYLFYTRFECFFQDLPSSSMLIHSRRGISSGARLKRRGPCSRTLWKTRPKWIGWNYTRNEWRTSNLFHPLRVYFSCCCGSSREKLKHTGPGQ